MQQRPTQVFISYAHADRPHLDAFRTHFGPVERGKNLTAWFDANLAGGQVWNDEIRRAINDSDIFVCLVTANFLNSSYIRDTELPAIWQAVRGRGALIIPVILEVSFWKEEFSHVQCLPHDAKEQLKPAADWRPKRNGFHAAAEQTAKAVGEWLKRLPPPPEDPGPGLSLLVTEEGFDLSPDAPAAPERYDTLQQRLLEGLRKRFEQLQLDAARSCRNTHPILCRDLDAYGALISEALADLDVVALVTSGSALGGIVEALKPPLPVGSMTESLEPELRAGFETLLREHARLVMGFAEGREIIARDRLLEAMIDRPVEARQTLHDVLGPMSAEKGLLTTRARQLIQAIDDGLMEGGVRSTEALLSALRHGGRAVGAITRAVSSKLSAADAVTLATFGALMAGDPNLETYKAAFRFLAEYSNQISALASNQPELRRLVDWTMEQIGARSKVEAFQPYDDWKLDDAYESADQIPQDFDADELHEMLCRGEAVPKSWLPWVTSLDFTMREELDDISFVAEMPGLIALELSGTSIRDLGPLARLNNLIILNCGNTNIVDVSPLYSIRSLEILILDNTEIESLLGLSNLINLKYLSVSNTHINDIYPVSRLKKLKTLKINWTGVVDLSPLSHCRSLKSLECSGNTIADLSPISQLPSLETLILTDMDLPLSFGGLEFANLVELVLLDSKLVDGSIVPATRRYISPSGSVINPDENPTASFVWYARLADDRAIKAEVQQQAD